MNNLPRIPDEFAGKHIFVTGGSGFMGKVLLEKLLRSCPDLACIYVLLRPKKGLAVQDRLKTIVSTPLFEPLLKSNPDAVSKLRAMAGDCSELGLGLSPADEALLAANVSYVFHAAATVRFDDPLKQALLINTRGTREVVELCKKIKNLKALEYVSTTYCFTNEPVLMERPYKTDLDWRVMIRLAETEDRHTLDAVTKKILDFQPNTYTFSKALAENIINDARKDIPAIIFRPAVVISSLEEPFPGWVDNLNGPFGIWAGALKGVLRFSYGDPNVALSYTPVDWSIRGMILCATAVACNSSLRCTDSKQVDVVNMEVSAYRRSTYADQATELPRYFACGANPIRYPRYHIGTSYVYFLLGTVLSELPYGLAIDTLLRLQGKKPRMIALYRKIFVANLALAPFMLNEFPIKTGKINQLSGAIAPEDRPIFGVDFSDELCGIPYYLKDYRNYAVKIVEGTFKYVLNETTPPEETMKKLKALYALEIVLNLLWAYVMYLTLGKFLMMRLLPGSLVLPL